MRLDFLKNRKRGDANTSITESETTDPSMPPAPSTIISDALTALSKATNTALANVEDHAREQVERANAQVMEARAERDEALKALRELELAEKGWNASAEKSEMTIMHQAETIRGLRAEMQQWKSQLARMEETCKDWKDQYMRAEEERNRLLLRIEELVSEQLAWNATTHAGLPPTIPRMAYSELADSYPSKRPITSVVPPPPLMLPRRNASTAYIPDQAAKNSKLAPTPAKRAVQGSDQSSKSNGVNGAASATKANPKTPRLSTTSRASQDLQAMSAPRSKVIRHVRAVIQVPVKEEEHSDEEGFHSEAYPAGPAYHENDVSPTAALAKKTPKRTSSRKRIPRVLDDDDDDDDDGESDRTVPTQSTIRTPRRRFGLEDDGVDELAMSAEDDADNGDDDYRPEIGKTRPGRRASTSARPSARKRKLDGESGTIGRSSTAKTPRKQ